MTRRAAAAPSLAAPPAQPLRPPPALHALALFCATRHVPFALPVRPRAGVLPPPQATLRGSSGRPGAEPTDLTPRAAVAFVLVASCMLLLLYFLLSKAFFYVLVGRSEQQLFPVAMVKSL